MRSAAGDVGLEANATGEVEASDAGGVEASAGATTIATIAVTLPIAINQSASETFVAACIQLLCALVSVAERPVVDVALCYSQRSSEACTTCC